MCEEYFMHIEDLKEHVRSVHPEEAGTEKEDKNEDDSQNQDLEQIPDEDRQDKENHIGFTCEFCDFKADKKKKLIKHVNSKHPDNKKPYTCNYCDEQLKSTKDIH